MNNEAELMGILQRAATDDKWEIAAQLAEHSRKVDLQLRLAKDDLRQNEWQWIGQGLRIGSTVKVEDTDLEGTVIRIEYSYNESGPSIDTLDVRLVTGEIEKYQVFDLEDITPRQYLNVYLTDRAYGGPQEGGWWYDTYEPVLERCQMVKGDAEFEHKMLQAELDAENSNRRPPSSVLSEGHYVAVIEAWPPERLPIAKPVYS